MTEREFVLIAFGITFIISLIISMKMENKRQLANKHTRGYTIGYLCAIWPMTILAGFILIGMITGHISDFLNIPTISQAMLILAVLSGLGIGIIKRSRWMFLSYVIVTFTPILWILLGIYLYRRWDELSLGEIVTPEVTVIQTTNKTEGGGNV